MPPSSGNVKDQTLKVDIKKLEKCCLCGSRHLELVMSLPASAVADHYVSAVDLADQQLVYPLDLELCVNCGHVQLSHVVNPDNIYSNYLYTTTTSVGLPDHFRKYANAILGQVRPKAGALVLDIGSNDGTLLHAFKDEGMRVVGVDPASSAAAIARERGVDTVTGYFNAAVASDIRNKYGSPAIVTANNVLANVEDVTSLIKAVRDLMSPDGVFVFETGYLLDIVRNSLYDTIYHEHLFYYSVRPMRLFFERLGMALFHAEPIPTKGGSLRGYVQLAGGPRAVSSSVREMEAEEAHYGIHTKPVFQTYFDSIEMTKRKLLALMGDLKSRGKTIAGYGASHSVTTLLHAFDLGNKIDFIVDDNPQKQNTYSPGFHIPVLSPDALKERNPDYVVILPWRFCDSIVSRNQAYLAGGGKFLVPIPELKEITL